MPRDYAKSPAVAGRLHNSPLPELLAYAFNHQFTGAIVLENPGKPRSGLFLKSGGVCRARAADMEQTLARHVLQKAEVTDQQLVRAAQVARGSQCDIFTAVERLGLLSRARLEQVRSVFVERQVHALVGLPPDTVYGFFPDLDTLKKLPGPQQALPAFDLIFACIIAEPSIDRCKKQLEPFKNERMTFGPEVALDLGRGTESVRTVIARLRRAPHSYEELRLLNLAEEKELIACVYALCLMHRVVREGNTSMRPAWPSRVPRRASSQALRVMGVQQEGAEPGGGSVRDTLPEVGYTPPPLEAEMPRRRLSQAELKRHWQEQGAESKALEAWAKAEGGDAVELEKAQFVVEKAAEFFPNNPRIRFYAGCLYRAANRLDQAAVEFRRVLTLEPNNIEAKRELELLNRRSEVPTSKGVLGRLLKKR